MTQTVKKQVIEEWINNNQHYTINLLQEMIRYKSVNPKFIDNPSLSECDKLQAFLYDYLLSLGLSVDKWDVYEGQPNVVATLKGNKREDALILNGHIDVVPAGNLSEWTVDPWKGEVQDGKLYGRGSVDMKAGVLSNIMVAKFMVDMGIELQSDLQLHIVVDEEGGGGGTRSVLERGYTGAGVIVTEPTNGIINPVEGGLQWVSVTVKGHSAHSAFRYSQIYPGYKRTGVNAIEKSMKILRAVLELERDRGLNKSHPLLPPGITTINPGVMLAGAGNKNGYPETITNPSIIPDYCIMKFSLKYLPNENLEDVKREFEEVIHHVSLTDSWLKENPPKVEWGLHGIDFPPVNTPLNHKLVTAVASSQESFNISHAYEGFVAVSDAAFYSGKGIPAIIYGPRGAQLHGPDEYVELASLYEVTKVLIMTALQWNGVVSD